MSNAFTVDQTAYRWSNDDGTEVTATYNKIINTPITVGDEGGTDFAFGAILRLRVLHQETGGDMGANNQVTQLQFDVNGAASWANVDATSSVVQSIASQLVDGADTTTTRRLGSGSFETPNDLQDDVDGAAGGADFDPTAGGEWEFESSFQVIGADVNDADSITFRFLQGGAAPDSITATATITIDKAAAEASDEEWAATQRPVPYPAAYLRPVGVVSGSPGG